MDRQTALEVTRYWDTWLAYRQHFLRVPGVQAAFLLGDELLLDSAHGLADLASGSPLTTDHLFRIASHSKTFTATAVLQLVEQGRLRLDDQLGSWLPDVADAPVGAATLRELLSHSAGTTRDGADGDHWQLERPFLDEAGLMAVARQPAVLGRNERFKYSNITFSLLGAVVEAASGQTYNAYVTEHLIDELGLPDTGPELPVDRAEELATGHTALTYADHRVPIDHVDTRAMSAATGFYATARDVVRWFAAHFCGDERLLTDDSKRLMRQRLWQTGPRDAKSAYGLGLALTTIGDRVLIGHGGGYPGHLTSTLADPTDRFAVTVLTNAIDGPAAESVTAAVLLLDLALSEDRGTGDDLDRFTGRFASLWTVVDVAVLGGRLWMLTPTVADPTASATELEVVDDHTLRIVDGPGYGSPGELVTCTFTAEGSVESVRAGSGTLHRPLAELVLPDRVRQR